MPKIIAYEKKLDKAFHNMSIALNENTEALVERIAKELAEFMRKNIPEHLINEYEYYTGCIAGVRFLHETIEACIKERLLCEPENKIGAEGVLMVIEK